MSSGSASPVPSGADGLDQARAEARRRVQRKREFSANLAAYVVVNAFLVVIWWMSGRGYFWPIWVMAGWGVGLAMHGYEVYFRRPITDADVEAEMRRSGQG